MAGERRRSWEYMQRHPEQAPNVLAEEDGFLADSEEEAGGSFADPPVDPETVFEGEPEPEPQPGENLEAKPGEEAQPPADAAGAEAKPEDEVKPEEEPPADSPEGRVKAAQRKMHDATTELAESRKENERLKAELEEARKATPAEPAPAEQPPVQEQPKLSKEERRAKLMEVSQKATMAALKEIDGLDQYDPEFEEKRAAAWSKANTEALLESGIGESSLSKEEIASIVKDQLKSEREAERLAQETEARKTAGQKAWEEAVAYGKKKGLNLDDDNSADFDLFEAAERKLPEDLRGQGFTPAVGDFLVNYVRTRTGKVAAQTEAERQRALETQKNNRVMGRGQPHTPEKAKPQGKSWAEMRRERASGDGLY